MSEPTAAPKRRTGLLIWLIVSQLLAVGTLVIWAFLAGMMGFAFNSGVTPEVWALAITVWAYPLFPLAMTIGAWIAFAFRKNRLAAVLSGLTFGPLGLVALFLWVAMLIGP